MEAGGERGIYLRRAAAEAPPRPANLMPHFGTAKSASLTQLTGPGCVWVSHNLRFTAPVRIGDTVTARAEIAGLVPEKGLLRVRTTCRNQRGELLLEGEAVLRKMGELEQGS